LTERNYIAALVIIVLIGCAGLLSPPATTAQEPAKKPVGDQPDEFQRTMTTARTLLRQGRIDEAINEYWKAAKLRDDKCAECFQTIGQVYFQLGRLKEAAALFRQTIELKPSNEAEILNVLGVALYLQNDKQAFEEAAVALQRSIELSGGKVVTAYYNLGFALIKSGKEEAGVAALKKFLELQPSSADASQARAVIANTRMIDLRVAAAFSVKSSTGADLVLEKHRGKIVLLDFWATWCIPCRVDIPEVRKIWKHYGGDQFLIIGINLDSNRALFDGYVKEESLTWPQYYDGLGWGNKIAQLYGVYAIPHTVLIDQDGVIRATGLRGEALSVKVDELLKKLPKQTSGGN
jgi:tetratricopeptide (TPR) repeat protein